MYCNVMMYWNNVLEYCNWDDVLEYCIGMMYWNNVSE